MTTLYLLNCADGSGQFVKNTSGTLGGNDAREVPHCPSGGTWVQVESNTLTFDLADWLQVPENQAEFALFFGAGFSLVLTFKLIGLGVGALLSMLR